MKRFAQLIFTFILMTILIACSNSNVSSNRNIEVIFNDVPFKTEQNVRVGYTLKTWEFEKEGLELQKIVVLDEITRNELFVIDKADLPVIHKDPLPASSLVKFDKLYNYFLSIQLPIPLNQRLPEVVTHQFKFSSTFTRNEIIVEGGSFSPRINEQPVVISSPLKGENIVLANQSTLDYHFYTMLFVNGQIYTSERYAFDSMKFNDSLTAYFDGDPTINTSYFNYGSNIYAVADGVVVQKQDGLPENSGNAHDVVLNSAIAYAGNYLVLDIGGGRYASYAHCKPNSITVNVGDRVREGDMLAKLGNSGNSGAPHLHFQISDNQDFFYAKGLPFVLKKFSKIGTVYGSSIPPIVVIDSMPEETSVISVE